MKSLLPAAVFLVLSISSFAQDATLDETLEWLKAKIEAYCNVSYVLSEELAGTDNRVEINVDYVKFEYDSCRIRFIQKTSKRLNDYTFDLVDITEIKLDKSEHSDKAGGSPLYYIAFSCYNEQDCITYIHDGEKSLAKVKKHWILISEENQNIGYRIVSAFKRAMELCGSKSEKF